jgi:hypothetical protein
MVSIAMIFHITKENEMSKASEGQALAVVASMAVDTKWEQVDKSNLQKFIELTPEQRGARFAAFLNNGGNLMIGSQVIKIDRTKLFNPADFIGAGWMIDEPQDEKSLALSELDQAKVRFETTFKADESSVGGEDKLKRLKKAGHVRLDAKIFQTLWENQSLIPESWKEKINGNTRYIFFDGTVLRDPSGNRCVLYLYWSEGQWDWSGNWLDDYFSADDPSAVLAS